MAQPADVPATTWSAAGGNVGVVSGTWLSDAVGADNGWSSSGLPDLGAGGNAADFTLGGGDAISGLTEPADLWSDQPKIWSTANDAAAAPNQLWSAPIPMDSSAGGGSDGFGVDKVWGGATASATSSAESATVGGDGSDTWGFTPGAARATSPAPSKPPGLGKPPGLPPGLSHGAAQASQDSGAGDDDADAQVRQFLKNANLLKYEDILVDNEIDFETLLELDQSDLKDMGIDKKGALIKFTKAIKAAKEQPKALGYASWSTA